VSVGPASMYWDSCVFYRYLTLEPPEYLHDIEDFIKDAKSGERRIYCSTVSFVEIRQSALKKRSHSSINQFFADMGRAFYPIDPNPNIMIAAGQLRDAQSVNPGGDTTAKPRVIGTADAIHLMTCLYLRDTMGVKDIVFHTFDDGKGKTWEGRCVPLLSFERWFPVDKRSERVAEVCGLTRCLPSHPVPTLLGGPKSGTSIVPQPRP
jgi:hypothetical protein